MGGIDQLKLMCMPHENERGDLVLMVKIRG
jgi:hypothetical protein